MEKLLTFSKIYIKSFIYNLIDVFMTFSKKIYDEYNDQRCYLYQNLTDTDSSSVFFVFICDLSCSVDKRTSRDITFKGMKKGMIFDRLDLSDDFWNQFDIQHKKLKKQMSFFEIKSIDKPKITVALNPKEYYEKFHDHSDNQKT